MAALAHTTGSPRLLRREGIRKVTTGGSKGAREAISFSTQLRMLGDVPDLDVYTAINLAMNRVEWKENRPYRRSELYFNIGAANLSNGIMQNTMNHVYFPHSKSLSNRRRSHTPS